MTLDEALKYREQKLKEGHKSDGCTFVRDFNLTGCCEMHDFLRRFRPVAPRAADKLLRQCIQSQGHPVLAWVYWAAVRLAYLFRIYR